MIKVKHIILGLISSIAACATQCESAIADEVGLADLNGKILLPLKFDDIRWIAPDCFRVTPKGDPKTVEPFIVNQLGIKIPTPPGAQLYDDKFPLPPPPPLVPHSKGADVAFPRLKQVNVPGATMREELGLGFYRFEKGGKFGVCDQNGKIIFSPTGVGNGGDVHPVWFDRFLRDTFDDNLQRVYKLYDENAKFITDLPRDIVARTGEYHDDLLLVELRHGGLSGYVNRNGEYQLKPTFNSAEEFNEGFASVSINDHGIICGALIDKTGKMVAGPFKEGQTEHFEDGLALVTLSNKLCGMVDHSGQFVFKPEFESLARRGDYIIGLKDNTLHVYSKKGELISKLPPGVVLEDNVGPDAWRFYIESPRNANKNQDGDDQEGDAAANRKYGVITSKGEIYLEADYDSIYGRSKDFVSIGTRNSATKKIEVGLMGPNKKFVIPQIYDSVDAYEHNAILYNYQKGFDKFAWMPDRDGHFFRSALWREFLNEYDLIGMTRGQVFDLLGQPDRGWLDCVRPNQVVYTLEASGYPRCGNSPVPIVFIEFDERNLVSGWRPGFDEASQPWNRTNVVYVKQKDDWRLVPKNAAESYK